jgi:hypothetical protein
MYEGQRARDVARFDEQNPDSPPEPYDKSQTVQAAFDNGQF